jgi:hypothetical protein
VSAAGARNSDSDGRVTDNNQQSTKSGSVNGDGIGNDNSDNDDDENEGGGGGILPAARRWWQWKRDGGGSGRVASVAEG